MKNIIPYKLFESLESPREVMVYLLDIFREAEDIGFKIEIEIKERSAHTDHSFLYKPPGIKVIIRKSNIFISRFKYSSISDEIESAVEYMKSIGYIGEFSWYSGHGNIKKFTPEEIRYLTSRPKKKDATPSKIVNFDEMIWVILEFTKSDNT